ncbi:OsmC family protein [Actinomadura sp. 3N407]|uniref:OsmC family protein n=1 Tax=Actinomadura sp. 3N407 TaxID=3457423 RepID=UPI003FCC7655
MGMHGGVAEHYRVPLDSIEPHATTLDYIVGATTGCLTGTFGGMLAALGQPTEDGALTSEAEGDIVVEDGVLRIARIRVTFRLRPAKGISPEKIRRAHERHHRFCLVARFIGGCIDITTDLEFI